MRIDVLYTQRCPHVTSLRGMISEVLQEEGLDATVEFREIRTHEEAVDLRFVGSPTIRVNGVDVEDGESLEDDYGLRCRQYDTDGVLTALPSRRILLEALEDAWMEELLGGPRRRVLGCC